MSLQPIEHSSLYCIFAEDHRVEVDGKTTVVGWFDDSASFQLPAEGALVLPRLAAIAVVTLPLNQPLDEMHLSLRLNDTVLASASIPKATMEGMRANGMENPGPLRAGIMRMVFQALNMQIGEEGALRVHLEMGPVVMDSNGLKFKKQDPDPTRLATV